MGKIIIMPKQGLQMTEGMISSWLFQEGDTVKEGEPLFDMETDKLAITIDAPASGTLLKILCPEGDSYCGHRTCRCRLSDDSDG